MSEFAKITGETLTNDKEFANYLGRAKIIWFRRGNTFVKCQREKPPDRLCRYGILALGGMILMNISPKELKEAFKKYKEKILLERQKTKEEYLAKIRNTLPPGSGFSITDCSHQSDNSSWSAIIMESFYSKSYSDIILETFLSYQDDNLLRLIREYKPGTLDGCVRYTPIEKVKEYIKAYLQE